MWYFCAGKIRVALLIQKVLALCLQYRVKLESHFASILLAIGVLEGVRLKNKISPWPLYMHSFMYAAPSHLGCSLRG
jgi:hypothetical protein